MGLPSGNQSRQAEESTINGLSIATFDYQKGKLGKHTHPQSIWV